MNLEEMTPSYGEMKINFFFKKGTDVGLIADNLLEKIRTLTAFTEATEHKLATHGQLFVSRNAHVNVFTDFKTFITIDPLSEDGEDHAFIMVALIIHNPNFTVSDAEPLVVNL